jgi:hypothetical protein
MEKPKYANMYGWSDIEPFEIVRWVSEKTAEIRAMKVKHGFHKLSDKPIKFYDYNF